MPKEDVIIIRSCPLTDSIFDIKKSLEESSICRVRKIFAAKLREECNDEPIKKVFYIWVEWDNTNASCMFTARLNHHREEALFKLDKWGQPIVTERDEYGNPTRHDHWIVRPSSRLAMQNDERCVFGNRENREKWEIYLAPGESLEDSDDEEEVEKIEEEQEEVLTLEPVLEIPQLKHNSPVVQVTPEPPRKTLSLFMPEPEVEFEKEDIEKAIQAENDAFMRENFNIIGNEKDWSEYEKYTLSKEELKKLSRGENDYNYIFIDNKLNKITFPDGTVINLNK